MNQKSFLRSGLSRICLGLAGALVAIIPASASPTTYQIDSGASFTIFGHTETITGTFGFDIANDINTAFDITLTGPSPEAGSFFFSSSFANQIQSDGDSNIACGTDAASRILCLNFFSPFGAGADTLHIVGLGDSGGPNDPAAPGSLDFSAIGSASPAAAVTGVPEPMSVTILGAALIGASRLRRKKGRRTV
jgi:hypothetical protein